MSEWAILGHQVDISPLFRDLAIGDGIDVVNTGDEVQGMCNKKDCFPFVFERPYDRILKEGFSDVCIDCIDMLTGYC